jgi:phospholipid/cholesterol/gamma-HCH transport system ATP-binding protein
LLDELIVQLQDSIDATVVIVSHELASILSIATNAVYLDADSRTMLASGNPRQLRDHSDQAIVRQFLTRSAAAKQRAASDRRAATGTGEAEDREERQ